MKFKELQTWTYTKKIIAKQNASISDSFIITHNKKTRITNNNIFPIDKEHNTAFIDQRLRKITKRVYIAFTLESEFTLSQLKYRSRYNSTNRIIKNLWGSLAFLEMEKDSVLN